MKTKMIGGFVLAAIFAVILITGSKTAAQPGRGFAHGFGGPRMFEALKLSEEQKGSIRNLFAANHETLKPLREQMHNQRQLLKEATQKQPFDESQVRFQAQELGKLQAELMVAHAALMNQVSEVLTPEQRASLSALHEERREKFKERHQQHRRGNPAPSQG